MRMLDLFSGSGSASRAAAVRGWEVVRIDNGEGTAADVRADLATWDPPSKYTGHFDLVWASPPCSLLSSANQRTRDVEKGLVLVRAALRIIAKLKPRWWVLENVHGATRAIGSLIGPPVATYGSFYLWGVFPPFEAHVPREKTRLSGRRRAERRAAIPWAISDGLVRACEALAREMAPAAARPGPELPPSSPRSSPPRAPRRRPTAPEKAPKEAQNKVTARCPGCDCGLVGPPPGTWCDACDPALGPGQWLDDSKPYPTPKVIAECDAWLLHRVPAERHASRDRRRTRTTPR